MEVSARKSIGLAKRVASVNLLISLSATGNGRERVVLSAKEERLKTMGEEEKRKLKHKKKSASSSFCSPINNLDDGCLMHIFSFLSPIPGFLFSLSLYLSLCLLWVGLVVVVVAYCVYQCSYEP